jgi:PadR family transcriptional regulator PadR
MDRELKRGTLELVLLQLLSESDRYGYEITSELANRSSQTFELKEGTLYPVLYRLESSGFVEPYWAVQDRGVPRKYYRITTAGRSELERQRGEWESFVAVIDSLLGNGASVENDR